MNEREFTTKVKEYLNYSSSRLSPEVFSGLEAARKRALENFSPAHAEELEWAGAHGTVAHTHGKSHHFGGRRWLALAVLLAALAGGIYWQQEMNQDDDIDAALLGGELPVNAYIDHGFQTWLERSSQH